MRTIHQPTSADMHKGKTKTLHEYLTKPGPRTLQVLILLALLLMWAWFVLTFPPAAHWTAACALLLNQLADSSRVLYSSHVEDASPNHHTDEGNYSGGRPPQQQHQTPVASGVRR